MLEAFTPVSFMEALRLKLLEKDLIPYAGGTDLMVQKRQNARYLFLNQINELRSISESDHEIFIGACCTYIKLVQSNLIPEILKKVIKKIASPAIRNIGTIGGNICNASPAGDTLPILYARNSKVEIASLDEHGKYCTRILPIEEFILGVRKIAIRETELLKQIILPKEMFQMEYYEKVGARQSEAIAKISFVGLLKLEEGRVLDARIAFGSVGPTVIRRKEIENDLIGKNLDNEIIHDIIGEYNLFLKPIDDQRSTASYRKQVALAFLNDFLRQ